MAEEPLVLIDVMNLAWRVGYVFSGLAYEGKPTGVFYGFLGAIWHLRQEVGRRLVFCWDGVPGAGRDVTVSWRKRLMPDYKARRDGKHVAEDAAFKAVKTALYMQLKVLEQVILWLGYRNVGVPGLEADDIISLITRGTRLPVLIFSTDQDMYQLLGPRVQVLYPKKSNGEYRYVTAPEVEQEYKVPIAGWADYLAMGGDSSDSIKPALGMGPKTALKLIQAGANPARPWALQPLALRNDKRLAKYDAVWPRLMLCYQMAALPHCWDDPRIVCCTQNYHAWPRSVGSTGTRLLFDEAEGLQRFSSFCADYGLLEHLAARHEFLA